jgi:hypothetical protein
MTEPSNTPPAAEEAIKQASVTALAEDYVAPTHFIPAATQENYAQIARDQAGVQGRADQFAALHERQPLDGYDHLAAWAREFDPSAAQGPSGLAVLQARALESARRDPYQAVIGDQALVEQGVAAQKALDDGTIGVTQSPTLEGSGLLPNPGPLSVPADTPTTSDPAVAEQQAAAAEQRDPGEQLPETPTPSAPPAKSSGGGHSK